MGPAGRRGRKQEWTLVGIACAAAVLVVLNGPATGSPAGEANNRVQREVMASSLVEISGPTPFTVMDEYSRACFLAFGNTTVPNPFGGGPYHCQRECGELHDNGDGPIVGAEIEVSLAVNPTNPDHLVAAWQQDRFRGSAARGIMTGASFDGGRTWSNTLVPGLTHCPTSTMPEDRAACGRPHESLSGFLFDRVTDPWVTFGPNGEVYVASLCGRWDHRPMTASASADGGKTWGRPSFVGTGTSFAGLADKETIYADPKDPRRVYMIWDVFAGTDPEAIITLFARSSDSGETWETPKPLSGPRESLPCAGVARWPGFAQLLMHPDGTLIALFSESSTVNGSPQHRIAVVHSPDQGSNWSVPAGLRGPTINPIRVTNPDGQQDPAQPSTAFFRTPMCGPDFDIDPSSGTLYAVWQDGRFGDASAIAFAASKDKGVTWTDPTAVSRTPKDVHAFTPSIAVSPQGTVAVAYYDFRLNDESSGVATDVWVVMSPPNEAAGIVDGSSWTRERRLTDRSFDGEKTPLQSQGYMLGDYNGLVATGHGSEFAFAFGMPEEDDASSIFFRSFH